VSIFKIDNLYVEGANLAANGQICGMFAASALLGLFGKAQHDLTGGSHYRVKASLVVHDVDMWDDQPLGEMYHRSADNKVDAKKLLYATDMPSTPRGSVLCSVVVEFEEGRPSASAVKSFLENARLAGGAVHPVPYNKSIKLQVEELGSWDEVRFSDFAPGHVMTPVSAPVSQQNFDCMLELLKYRWEKSREWGMTLRPAPVGYRILTRGVERLDGMRGTPAKHYHAVSLNGLVAYLRNWRADRFLPDGAQKAEWAWQWSVPEGSRDHYFARHVNCNQPLQY
jgi:hypothetical protein